MTAKHHRSRYETKIKDYSPEKLLEWKEKAERGEETPFSLLEINWELKSRSLKEQEEEDEKDL